MPENNQIQDGFQPGYRLNKEIQQTTGNQIQENKKHSSWFTKILGVIFLLLGIGLIGLGIHDIFEISSSSSWYYSTYTIRDIIMKNGTWAFFIVGIIFTIIGIKNLFWGLKLHTSWFTKITSILFCLLGIGLISFFLYKFLTYNYKHYSEDYIELCIIILISFRIILIGLLSYRTPDVEIYYHPTWLTKILSGIYLFLGVCLIRSGLRNFSLIGTPDLSFLKILYIGGIITLCGIFYILLGRLLYSTKSRLHLGFSLLSTLITNILFIRIINTFSNHNYGYGIDDDFSEQFGILIILFTIIYFSISTIRWIIKCRKFNKKGIINPKYLDKTPSKKKLGIITTIVLFSLIIINLIYGKINWSKIPEIDDSIFSRDYHQTKLPDDEDALFQLRNHDRNKIIENLDLYSNYEDNSDNDYYVNNKDISRKKHPEECIIIYSGGNEYCGTWAWNKNTLDRVLNNYYFINNYNYYTDNTGDYLSIDGKKVTIFEYIQKNESEINSDLKELDRITSLDYYLPDDLYILDLMPQFLQSYSRASRVLLQYYIYQEDWNMVMFIIKLNYKIVDLLNNTGSVIYQLISIVIQGIVDSSINSYMQLFPEDFKNDLGERYLTKNYNKDEIVDKMMKGEYTIRNWAKTNNILGDIGKNIPSLTQFLFHFPFYSDKDTNKLMNYSYYIVWKENGNNTDIIDKIIYKKSLYNRYGKYPYNALMPRITSTNNRIDRNLYHKEALIKNLKSGKYNVWFNELDWNSDISNYENNRILPEEELIENLFKKYSDIIQPCFGKDTIDFNNTDDIYFGNKLLNQCSRTLENLEKERYDDLGLKEILVDITQFWIDYNENLTIIEDYDCYYNIGGDNWDICNEIFDKQEIFINKMNSYYKKFYDILENIKNKYREININEYFYIPEININKYFYIPYEINDLNKEFNNELPESLNIIKEYSDIIQPCFGKDIIDPIPSIGIYHNEFEELCYKTLSNLKEQEKDDFGLKEVLIEITKSLINYSKFEIKYDACLLKESWKKGDICDEIFDKELVLIDKIKENYKKLSDILENIENKNPGININNYFYIPYEKVYGNNSAIVGFFIDEEKSKELLNDIILQEFIDKINKNEQKILSSNKSNEQLNYEKLANLTKICIGEDILNGNINLSYDNHISQCNYIISEMEKKNLTGDFIELNKILISISKEWIEYTNNEKNEELLFKTDGIVQEGKYGKVYENGDSPEWNILFEKQDENLENFKKYYLELENITKKIKEKFKINPEIDFYIPYSIIKENTFKFFYKNPTY